MTSTRKPITIEKWRRKTRSLSVMGLVTAHQAMGQNGARSIPTGPQARKSRLHHAAVHADDLAVDVRRSIGTKKTDHGGHFLRRSRACGGYDLLDVLRIEGRIGHASGDHARRND